MPAISADGRFVAFMSSATNLHADDSDTLLDVFVRDLQANTTTLVSRADGATGVKGNDVSLFPSISADGRLVTFDSPASNLHPDDARRDRGRVRARPAGDMTTLVSRATGAGGANSDAISIRPAISATGAPSRSTPRPRTCTPTTRDAITDVFVRDLQANTTTLVSRATGAAGAKGDGSSSAPAISGDGRFVAFNSGASNLDPDDDATSAVTCSCATCRRAPPSS